MNSTNLADYLEVWGFEKDTIIFSDGSLGFGLKLSPVDVSCWDSEQINSYFDQIINFLNGLPAGNSLQFVQDIKPGNDQLILRHKKLLDTGSGEIAAALTDARCKKLLDLDAEGLLPVHGLKVFWRTKPFAANASSLLKKSKLFPEIPAAVFEKNLSTLDRQKSDLRAGLQNCGINSESLTSEEITELMYEQWNPLRSVSLGAVDADDVRGSLLFTDVSNEEDGFSLGKMKHRVISLKLLPDQTYASMAASLRSLPFDSRLFLTVEIPDQQKELENLQTQRRLAFSMVTGRRGGMADIESEAKLSDLESLLEQMIAQGEKVFKVGLNILLRSTDQEDLDTQVSTTLMKLRELGGAEAMCETIASFDIFSSLALPNARVKERVKRLKTSNLADFLPLYGPWPGHDHPSALLRSRMGSLVSFDPFSSDLTNANMIVSGGSGAGKSFAVNILMLHLLKEDPRIYIIDIGGSYKKLADGLGGQYIPLSIGGGLSLNPFDLLAEEERPSEQKIKFLVGLVELMTKDEGLERLPRLERSEVETCIQSIYEKHKSPTLSNLKSIFDAHSESSIRRLGKILTSWCEGSPFGQFVDRPTNIELSKAIVCYDLKGLEVYPDLQAVYLYIITDFVWREVQRWKADKKFVIFDECWRTLENEAGASFISDVFRTFRKYFASAIAISQNIDDFAKSKVANAILPNASIKWVLRQKGADQERLREVLNLNDNELSLVASLHQERGVYSECFLMAGDHRSVVAIESTPLEYWIATTDPRDLAKLEELQKKNPEKTPLEILNEISEKFPNGVLTKQEKLA